MIPFFLSAPRTRSSILFELAQPYLIQKHGHKKIEGHAEYFLTRSVWAIFEDMRTNMRQNTQMMPVYKNQNMIMHHVYPPLYDDVRESVLQKLEQLKIAKADGVNFNLKGTIECRLCPDEILNFYHDRKLVITKRHNIVDLVASTLFALEIKAFHVRQSNLTQYKDALQPITLSEKSIAIGCELIEVLDELWALEKIAKDKGIECVTTYYEDLDTFDKMADTLDDILETDEWREYLTDELKALLPIYMPKDYKKLITNYDELSEAVSNQVKRHDI